MKNPEEISQLRVFEPENVTTVSSPDGSNGHAPMGV